MSVDVFILTTEGPVRIQRITEEDPSLRSVVCSDGRAEILPVSADYDDFVREPIGVIERLTGHPVYRMDVDGVIQEGRSWQLATFIAHMADAPGLKDGIVVFATGEVDRGLDIRPVDHVDRKLAALSVSLPDLGINLDGAMIMVPEGEPDIPLDIGGVPVRSVRNVEEALNEIGLPPVASMQPTLPIRFQALARHQAFKWLVGMTMVVGIVLLAILQGMHRWQDDLNDGRLLDLEQDMSRVEAGTFGAIQAGLYGAWLKSSMPDRESIHVEAIMDISETGNCDTRDDRKRVTYPTELENKTLCSINVRSSSKGYLVSGRMAYWPNGLEPNGKPARNLRGSAKQDSRVWSNSFDTPPGPNAIIRSVSIVGPSLPKGSQPWNADLVRFPAGSNELEKASSRVEALGYRVIIIDYPLN